MKTRDSINKAEDFLSKLEMKGRCLDCSKIGMVSKVTVQCRDCIDTGAIKFEKINNKLSIFEEMEKIEDESMEDAIKESKRINELMDSTYKTVTFKSTPENFKNESNGDKCNTVRKKDSDERFKLLDKFIRGEVKLRIIIEEVDSIEAISRKVSNVTTFEDEKYYIISWRN